MNKTDFLVLLHKNGLYENNPDYLSYFYNILSQKTSAEIVSALKDKKPLFIHDVWNAYAYGDIVKFVYIKNRANPKKNKDLPAIEKTERSRDDDSRFSSSISRARARVFELASCNEFQHFCTFTLNKDMKDRNDLSEFRKSLSMLFRNINRERDIENLIKYLLIPEPHKKGGWHMHGLLTGLSTADLVEFKLTDNIPQKLKKQIKNGEKIYNFPRYADKFGFFTATDIKNKNACSVYLTKYITKDLGKSLLSKGQHLFFASQGLKGREVLAKNCDEIPPFDTWDFENDFVKIKTVSLSEKSDGEI